MKRHPASSNSEVFAFTDLRQIRVLADPLRWRMLRALHDRSMTTKQLARELGERPSRLYHHVNALESVGLIQLVETKQKRGMIEKYYKARAENFVLTSRLLPSDPELSGSIGSVDAIVREAAQAALEGLKQVLAVELKADAAQPSAAAQLRIRVTASSASRLVRGLEEWLRKCRSASREDGDLEYTATVAFVPARPETSP